MIEHNINGWLTGRCSALRSGIVGAVLVGISLVAAYTRAAEGVAAPAEQPAAQPAAIETVRERYADGHVKIERDVTTDSEGNYVNHGDWRMWSAAGKLVAEGSYAMGRRDGAWTRWVAREEAPLLASAPFDQFEPPFVSRARFVADQLDGEWTIADAGGRKCSTVTFKDGRRSGPATLWLPGGSVYREATFLNALPVGDLRERSTDGELKTVATYVAGQQLVTKVTHFPGTQMKQVESACLGATVLLVAPDDFWQLRFAQYAVRGDNLRHGPWKSWYPNGQLQSQGFYQYDRESGVFTWWHAQGQEAVKGTFTDGRPDGTWTWWHANGQKAAEGQYRLGSQVGSWRQWADDGQLVQRKEVDGSPASAQEELAESGPGPRFGQHSGPPEPHF